METKRSITTIQVTEELWKELNIRKNKGDTMEDVIRRMILEEPPIKPRSKKKK